MVKKVQLSDMEFGFLKQLFVEDDYIFLKDIYRGKKHKPSYYTGSYNKLSNIKAKLSDFIEEEKKAENGLKLRFKMNASSRNLIHFLIMIYDREDWTFYNKHVELITRNKEIMSFYADFRNICPLNKEETTTESDIEKNTKVYSLLFPKFFSLFLLNRSGFIALFEKKQLKLKLLEPFLNDNSFLDTLLRLSFSGTINRRGSRSTFEEDGAEIQGILNLIGSVAEITEDFKPNKILKTMKLLDTKQLKKHNSLFSKIKLMAKLLESETKKEPMVQHPEKKNAVAPSTSSEYVAPHTNNQKHEFSRNTVIGNINDSCEGLDYEIRD